MFQIIHRKRDVNYARVTEIQTRYNIVILHGFVILARGSAKENCIGLACRTCIRVPCLILFATLITGTFAS